MAKFTFKGGIHPYDGKDLSRDKAIIDAVPGEIMVYPLSQHIGAPAVPTVTVGEMVKKGQKIAEAAEGLSVSIHCSIDGIVEEVSDREVVVRERTVTNG